MPKRDFPGQAPRPDPTVSPSVPQSASLGGPGCPLPQNSRAEGKGTAAKAAGLAARGLAESGRAASTCRAAETSFGDVREGQASLPGKGEGAAGQLAGRALTSTPWRADPSLSSGHRPGPLAGPRCFSGAYLLIKPVSTTCPAYLQIQKLSKSREGRLIPMGPGALREHPAGLEVRSPEAVPSLPFR